MPAAGLLKGDRLEPGNDLPDVFQFDQRVPPFTCTFWRPALETRCHHRNPLWNLEVGCTPEHCLTIDWQHDCSLGVFQTYLGCLMHRLLELNAWGAPDTTADARAAASVLKVMADLDSWYKTPLGRQQTRLQELTATMFGTHSHPACHMHAAETNGFLEFAVEVLLAKFEFEGKANWVSAGTALVGILRTFRTYPALLPAPAQADLLTAVKRYYRSMSALQIDEKPKDHALLHLVERAGFQGAPSLYANWLDEDVNRSIKACSMAAHSSVWEVSVLCAFHEWKTKSMYKGKRQKL